MPYQVNPDFGYLEYKDGGSGAPDVQEFDVDTGSNVEPLAGVVVVTGTSVYSDGSVANALTLNAQATLNTFLIGAGALTTMTEFGPLTNGELIIGSTGLSPVAGSITSTDGSVTVSGGAGTIDLSIAAADDAILTITGDSGGALSPTAGNINVLGGTGITTTGSGSTLTLAVTGASAFTTGSVIFWGGSAFEEDNANFFWDDTNNRIGIGTATPLETVHVVGNMLLNHVAAESDDHALEIIADANGFTDVKALDIDYITGALAAGEDEEAMLVNIDESASTGGIVAGYLVLTTAEGSATVNGYETGININPIVHESGTFGDADNILNKAVDVTVALASGGAGAISIFVADNDTITIGDAATWDEMEIILDTGASGSGIAPTWEYSTGGAAYSAFAPADGTNGFKNTGAILWDSSTLAGWATATSGEYEIRITRTRNSLSTTPIIDELQISATTEFKWDKNGDVNLNSLTLLTPLAVTSGGTGLATITDGGVMLGSGTGAVTPLGQATNGQLVIGSTGTDPVLGSILSADASVVITAGAGSIDLAVNDLIKTNHTNGLGTHNLGMFLAAGVTTIKGADGNALSASNPGYVTLRSNVTEGKLVTYEMTANFTFNDVTGGSSMFAGSLFGMTTGDTTTGGRATPFYLYAAATSSDTNLSFFCGRYPGGGKLPFETTLNIADGASGNADTYRDTLCLETIGAGITDYDSSNAHNIGLFTALINGSDDWAVQTFGSATGIGIFGNINNFVHSKAIMGQGTNSYFLANGGTAPTDTHVSDNRFIYSIDEDQNTLNIVLDTTMAGSPAGAVDAILNIPLGGPNSDVRHELQGTLIVGGLYNDVILRQVGDTVNTTARQFYLFKGGNTAALWQYEEFTAGDRLMITDSIKLR